VTTLQRRLVRIGNRIGVWMYRALDGRLSSFSKNAKVLMITTPGRRTGVLHSTCVRYLDTPEGLLVWGTASGAPRDPDWFRNLRKAKLADIQVRSKTMQVVRTS
jgi:deazaflavin-dependent oxidoreductase (nitroreductase family)